MNKEKSEVKDWKKIFLIIWSGQAFSLVGSSVVSFALIWWIVEVTGSPSMLAIATFASFLPQGIFGPFIGAIIDRHDRKKIMIFADLFIAAVTSLILISGMFFEVSVWLVIVVMFLRSLGSALHTPALQAATPLLVPEDKLPKIAGWNQVLLSGAQIVGPVIGAMLISIMPISQLVLVDIIGAIIAISSLLLIKLPELQQHQKSENKHIFEDIKEGFVALKSSKGIFKLSIIIAVLGIMYAPIATLYPLMTKTYFNGTAIHASMAEATFGIGMIIGSIILGVWGGTKKKVYTIFFSVILLGISIFLAGLVPADAFKLFLATCVLMGLAIPFFNGEYTALLQSKMDVKVMGRIFSLINAMLVLATPIGLLSATPIAEKFGVNVCFIFFGIGTIVLGIVSLFIKDIRNIEGSENNDNIENMDNAQNLA